MKLLRNLTLTILLAASTGAIASPEMTDGEIRRVDKHAGKLTIRHGELKNVGMRPMTMMFRVRDKAMLDKVMSGDKVRIAVEKIDGALTVIALEKVKP